MKAEEKKLLADFESSLRQLMRQHDELKRKYADLEKLLEQQKEETNLVRKDLKRLETDYTNLKIAQAISINGGDVKDARMRLSKLVREVDKCIALLNE
ncbi:hypothetical protein [Bacteroides sp. 519]|uniref:hypothetical protein n=1 Tax=Bacteroides sp. 519 TaxID=2302937 RepID=UPI0013D40960|nr:hypothetical protein [Bacteroides sp. 519]NDV56940.1 hypothetical protein [Bacteroides sp. 519]